MANKITCSRCNGAGHYDALISQHGDEKESVTCSNCNGKGFLYVMSDDDERDYHADYW